MRKYIIAIVILLLAITNQVSAQDVNDKTNNSKLPELPGEVVLNFGFGLLRNVSASGTSESEDFRSNWFRSKSLSLAFFKPFDLGEKFSFRPGLGLNFDKLGTKEDLVLQSNNRGSDGTLVFNQIGGTVNDLTATSVIKNQLAITSLELPVELKYSFTGTSKKSSAFIVVGASAAVVINSYTKSVFTDKEGDKRKTYNKDDFALQKTRLSVYTRVGWRSVSLFYRTYVSDLFLSSGPAGTADTRLSTFGISISGL